MKQCQVPGLQLIVVNPITLSEDEEIVLLIALTGLVLHIPVVFPSNLVVIPGKICSQPIGSWEVKETYFWILKPDPNPKPVTHHLVHSPSLPLGPAFVSLVSLPQAENKPQTGSPPHPSCPWFGREEGAKVKSKEVTKLGVVTHAYTLNISETEARGVQGA